MHYGDSTGKRKMDALIADLEALRNPRETLWREIDRHLVPGMCRFELTDQDQDTFRDDHILDSAANQAFITCENGLIANVTNPSQPWIKLKPGGDPDLAEYGPAATWYDDVARVMLDTIEDAGCYEVFQDLYGYAIKFSNGLFWMEEDYEQTVNCRVIPMGQWWIAKDHRGDLSTIYRKIRMTVGNVVPMFGRMTAKGSYDWSNFSDRCKQAWDDGRYQTYIDVGHMVMPNPEWNPRYRNSKEKRFKSCYFELGGTSSVRGSSAAAMTDEGKYLRESGYDEIPAFAFQWHVTGDDIYGLRCPGLMSLPDNRELQHWKLKKTTALDKIVEPPTYGPPWTKFQRVNHLPGGHTAVQDTDLQRGGIRRLYDQDARILEVMDHIQEMKANINKAFYVDVFRMLDSMVTGERQMTATEIAARQEEKLVQLVGVLNRYNRRVLNPFIQRLFTYLYKQGKLPPIPEELQGQPVKVEYISTMAQAMRSVNMSGIDRVLETAVTIATAQGPGSSVWNKLDVYQLMDEKAHAAGAPVRIMRGDEQVAEIEAAQAKAAQQKQMMETIGAASQAARNLAQAPTDGKNALTDVVNGLEEAA